MLSPDGMPWVRVGPAGSDSWCNAEDEEICYFQVAMRPQSQVYLLIESFICISLRLPRLRKRDDSTKGVGECRRSDSGRNSEKGKNSGVGVRAGFLEEESIR